MENGQNDTTQDIIEKADDSAEKKPVLEMRTETKKPFTQTKVFKEIRDWLVSLAIALVVVGIIHTFLFTVIRVEGRSMQDTLYTGDRLITTVIDYKLFGLNRFDVTVCHFPNRKNERFVKRIIGLPGETIEVRNGVTLINGEPIEEPFLTPEKTERYHRSNFGPYEIPEDCYFVMGDHRDDSTDSLTVGPIPAGDIIGRARVIMWPLNRLGILDGSETY